MCKLCGHAHWSNEKHTFGGKSVAKLSAADARKAAASASERAKAKPAKKAKGK